MIYGSSRLRSSCCAVDKFAVDMNIAQLEMRNILDDAGLSHTFKIAVRQPDIFDGRVLETAKIQGVARLMRVKIAYLHVADHRREFTGRPFFIEEIDGEPGGGNLTHGNVADIDV